MKRPIPINKEAPFSYHEFFFSTTDTRGVIEFGNDVFLRVSGYRKEEIIGAPHNIIRHPDMPKSVFKIFWESLKNNEPICAYVKNLSQDGSYYWVFAAAFPVGNKYLSIRFKPSSDLFKTVEDLYVATLSKEKQTSMIEGETFLLDSLRSLGFKDYKAFMIHAMITELKSLESYLHESSHRVQNELFRDISAIHSSTSTVLGQNFDKVSDFSGCSLNLSDQLKQISHEFRKLNMLSLNMNILASKFGNEAATLSVISDQFSKIASQIETELTTFTSFSQNLLEAVSRCSLDLSCLKIQMNMLDFFLKESLNTNSADALAEMKACQEIFTQVSKETMKSLLKELNILGNDLMNLASQMVRVRTSLNGLEIVKQIASIESSRSDKLKVSFDTYLQEMKSFNELLKMTMAKMSGEIKILTDDSTDIMSSTKGIQDNVSRTFNLVFKASA